MSIWHRFILVAATLAQAIAALWLVVAFVFLARGVMGTSSAGGGENLVGMTISFLWAAGFTFASALLSTSIRKNISKKAFKTLAVPAVVYCGALFFVYLGGVAYDLLSRV